MRSLTSFALVLAGLGAHSFAHTSVARRKTLGFGPDLPHARFQSDHIHAFVDTLKDPYTVARDFLSRYDDVGRTYIIRPDSYTDHATGVTHVYARQVIGGIEVANAHVNLNVKDGRVLRFGDSFFPSELETDHGFRVHVHPHADHCARLSSALDVQRSASRSVLSRDRARVTRELANLEHLYTSNCVNVPSVSSIASGKVNMDPRRPLLAFLASALPENHPESRSMTDDIEERVSKIVMTQETRLLGDHAFIGTTLSNVPGTVGDVEARVVWVQVPTEHGVQLELAHRFEVEMEYNWYETTVTTETPHRILSVVDWVRDSPMPRPAPDEEGYRPGNVFAGKKGAPQPPELNKASYLVFPWGTSDPVDAARKKEARFGEADGLGDHPLSYGGEIVEEFDDTLASPVGWHTLPFSHDPSVSEEEMSTLGDSFWRTTETTWGNNVFAQENWIGEKAWILHERPLAYPNDSFSYPYSPEPMETPDERLQQARMHVNASVTQLFYTSNMAHDLFYRYGFTEAAGNFQQYNFGRGGAEGDAVIAGAQEGGGYNNAGFSAPPDGQNGRCHVYLWNTNSPYPDGDMAADVIIHELSHGLSVRLTGGPMNSGCLGFEEAGGMGEGWGDLIAITIRSTSTYANYGVGAWASNKENGVRKYLYSTNAEINPSTYATLDDPAFFGLHQIGEVWAEMLWIVQQRLIAKHGFSETLFPPVPGADGTLPLNDFYRPPTFDPLTGAPDPLVPKHGNTLMLQLVVNGMKMQPCSPSFFDARAAIIDADKVLTGGENACEIWRGFAERGLGVDAEMQRDVPWRRGMRTNGFKVPDECGSDPPLGGDSESEGGHGVSLWYSAVERVGKWISRLSWGFGYDY